MRSLGILGDNIEISGKEKATPAMFMPSDIREKENKYIVGIDRTRYNVRVAIGEFVTISKTNGCR